MSVNDLDLPPHGRTQPISSDAEGRWRPHAALVGAAILLALLGSPAMAAGEHRHGAQGSDTATGRPFGREWTRYPLILPAARPGGSDRAGADLALKNIDAPQLVLFPPAGTSSKAFPVAAGSAHIEVLGPKLGNFQWIMARQAVDGGVTVASTAYAFNNPGPAPEAMLLARKSELEIIPQPLPREHSSYRESEKWRFLVRFQGQPLAGEKVRLETEYGTRTTVTTGQDGMATVLFPRDADALEKSSHGGHGPRRANFVLAVEHDHEGTHYLTAFNYGYGPDPDRSRSPLAGAAFALLGMVLAAPLWRRRNAGKPEAAKEHAQ